MPKIYEYLGIIFFFYSNEHEPIHVHARKGEFESKATIVLTEGIVSKVVITNVKGKKPLKGKDLADLKDFLSEFADDIVRKWVDYFVYHKRVDFRRINKRLK
ncbi:protein of unknown function [Ekhidna lutea]|uniref:DUF4160 domain-containing protein n=1 Tax=Ekhidna lutea TaxID=447679 RepID=A0A239EH36_EKHLU|nr:DUF4160 domain-containing protein [Ekhidna lutea]SNS43202.1 protein of unknown function [Ekhidna lutea]